MISMRNLGTATAIIAFVMVFAACEDHPEQYGHDFMPDMYYTKAYKTYYQDPYNPDSTSMRRPVAHTIPRGALPDSVTGSSMEFLLSHYTTGTEAERAMAAERLRNPVPYSEGALAEGKRLFNINCAICHGEKGDGQGYLVQIEKYPSPPPDYKRADIMKIKDGQIFFAMTYGKNNMGSYAGQISVEDRWKVVHYVRELQGLGPSAKAEAPAEPAAMDEAAAPAHDADAHGEPAAMPH